jgi:hypothetical protein
MVMRMGGDECSVSPCMLDSSRSIRLAVIRDGCYV